MIYGLCGVGSLKPLGVVTVEDFVLHFCSLAMRSRFSDLNARALIQEDLFRMQTVVFLKAVTDNAASNWFLLGFLTRQRVAWPSVSVTVTSWIWIHQHDTHLCIDFSKMITGLKSMGWKLKLKFFIILFSTVLKLRLNRVLLFHLSGTYLGSWTRVQFYLSALGRLKFAQT